jgi:hypothetical protein
MAAPLIVGRLVEGGVPWQSVAIGVGGLVLLLVLAFSPTRPRYFSSDRPIEREAVECAMGRVAAWNRHLTACALERLGAIPGLTIYGPRDPACRTSLVAFNVRGHDPMMLAHALNDAGVEVRAGCHCATLAMPGIGIRAVSSSFYLQHGRRGRRAIDARRHRSHVASRWHGRPARRILFQMERAMITFISSSFPLLRKLAGP